MTPAEGAKVLEALRQDAFARSLGIEILEAQPGYSRAKLALTEQLCNLHGLPHGGAIFALADTACAAASHACGRKAYALTMNISYLGRAEVGRRLYAEAREEKASRHTALYHVRVTDDQGNPIASCHSIVHRTGEPFPAEGGSAEQA